MKRKYLIGLTIILTLSIVLPYVFNLVPKNNIITHNLKGNFISQVQITKTNATTSPLLIMDKDTIGKVTDYLDKTKFKKVKEVKGNLLGTITLDSAGKDNAGNIEPKEIFLLFFYSDGTVVLMKNGHMSKYYPNDEDFSFETILEIIY